MTPPQSSSGHPQGLWRGIVLTLVTGASCALAGCTSPGGVLVPAGYESLPPCETSTIAVEDLAQLGAPDCNLEGSTLSFPDGTRLVVGEVGGVLGHAQHQGDGGETAEILVVNWGLPGVAASRSLGDQMLDLWASSEEAEALQLEQLSL